MSLEHSPERGVPARPAAGRLFAPDDADLETFIADRKFGSTAEADQAALA